ncbi:DNA topoisomerase 3-like isoform X2 [Galleria mellonella]|uniref:DNA topoisomerase 3-like isoform X2 n=1 Tax=Galleria mellonella TaxID=7137 RepID=A0ABM3MBW1_GALME|nr:DNA topoisomerase 3-like isoform X2 [Galleria mellonella]
MAHLTICVGFIFLVILNFTPIDAETRVVRSPQFGSYANSNAQANAGSYYGRPGYNGGRYEQPRYIGGGGYGRPRGPPLPPPRLEYGRGPEFGRVPEYGRGDRGNLRRLEDGSGTISISKSISISRGGEGGLSQSSANSAAAGKRR